MRTYLHIYRNVARHLSFFAVTMLVIFVQTTGVNALTPEQKDLYNGGIRYYDLNTDNCTDTGGSALVGKDNPDRVWNYFRSHGLSEEQTAGIMGNLEQESHFDPEVMEKGGRSENPADAGSGGWGLIQWTPGGKVIGLAKQAGVTGHIYELSTQLDLVWQHMNNHPDVTGHFDLAHFKSMTDPQEAAHYFGTVIEGYGIAGNRYKDVPQILAQYKGKTADTTTASSTGPGSCAAQTSSLSPDCNNVNGNAAILCEAKKYDVVDYVSGGGHSGGSAFHSACPTPKANDSNCGLDCSGLVSVAVYDAFHNDKSWTTFTLASDSSNWKKIALSDVKPGDVIEPNPDHVEIIDHVAGSTIYTFGAHTSSVPQPEQVSAVQYTKSGSYAYYRYIGQGGTP